MLPLKKGYSIAVNFSNGERAYMVYNGGENKLLNRYWLYVKATKKEREIVADEFNLNDIENIDTMIKQFALMADEIREEIDQEVLDDLIKLNEEGNEH